MMRKNIKHNFLNGACTYCGMGIAEAQLPINRHANGKMNCREGDDEEQSNSVTPPSLGGMISDRTPNIGMTSSLAGKISDRTADSGTTLSLAEMINDRISIKESKTTNLKNVTPLTEVADIVQNMQELSVNNLGK